MTQVDASDHVAWPNTSDLASLMTHKAYLAIRKTTLKVHVPAKILKLHLRETKGIFARLAV